MTRGIGFGFDGKTRAALNQLVFGVDIQGISLGDATEFLPTMLVDKDGKPIDMSQIGGGGGTESGAIEMTTLVNADQLRVDTAKTVPLPSLLGYTEYVISAYNGTNQDIKVTPWNSAPVILEDDSIGYFATAATTDNSYSWVIPKLTTGITSAYMLNEMQPKSNGAGTLKVKDPAQLFKTRYNLDGAYMLAYKAVAAPTSGSVTFRIFGKRR